MSRKPAMRIELRREGDNSRRADDVGIADVAELDEALKAYALGRVSAEIWAAVINAWLDGKDSADLREIWGRGTSDNEYILRALTDLDCEEGVRATEVQAWVAANYRELTVDRIRWALFWATSKGRAHKVGSEGRVALYRVVQ